MKRSITDILNNFKIDTDEGVYLQYANLHSFTFSIHREVDNGKLENLVLSYQNDGTYNVKILKYDLTAQEKIDLQNDRLKTIQNPIITIPLQSFNTNLVFDSCGEYTETIYVTCSSGHHSFGNGTAFDCSFWNLSGGTPPRVYTVTKYKCIDAGGSSGGGGSSPIDSGFGPNPTPGGGGGGLVDNTYPIKYPTHETNPVDYEEGISAPVLNSENSDDIRNMGLFYQNLSPQQRQWANEDPEKYNQLIKYQIDNEWSEESEEFAIEILDASRLLEINAIEVWNDYDIFVSQMSISEKGIFDNLLSNRKLWYMVSAKKAFDKAKELYPNSTHNGIGDAFRHALWNGLCVLTLSGNLGEQLTTAHENKPSQYPFNYKETEMDLYNNEKGRQIAITSNLTNIVDKILNDLNSGYLRYLNNLDPINNNNATYYSLLIPTDR